MNIFPFGAPSLARLAAESGRPEPIGLLAGAGRFPIYFAEKARAAGIPVICAGIRGMADPILESICDRFFWRRLAGVGGVIRGFRREGVRRWTMAGKVHKVMAFSAWRYLNLLPDLRTLYVWLRTLRHDRRDDAIMLTMIDEFAKDGLACESALELCPELLVRAGTLTRRSPTIEEEADMRFGWDMAREMGRLDIGQSVMVRERVVIAVEAIEGTDAAIRRAGELSRRGFVVVKVAKPEQDMRFDVPTIGTATIETIHQAGGTALAIEANRTIILDEEETVALADRYGISIVAR